ncbi:hypothetical protein ACFORO_12595 [Amycolatopsis halotolerans]|uniref:Uncharacterized protein n=1 Tax=Amycolatopsis halotolerans TaxID=330083 RepID=A0ABV7QGK3_9PSEU
MTHPKVPHPSEFAAAERRFWTWLNRALTSVLGHNLVFAACFVVPLAVIPASDTAKLIVGLIFSNWFQAWALPVLQKGQAQAELQRAAKADADHTALVHIASTVDDIARTVANRAP